MIFFPQTIVFSPLEYTDFEALVRQYEDLND